MGTVKARPKLDGAKKGVSLVEMVIAIFILAIVIMSIMMAMIISTRNTAALRDDENAYQFALEVLEDCERIQITSDDTVYRTAVAGKSRNRNADPRNSMKAVAGAVVSPTLDLEDRPISAEVTVDVTWNSALGGTKRISMTREVSVSGWQNVGDKSY
jgi:Tfp pilus assembly protein PilX